MGKYNTSYKFTGLLEAIALLSIIALASYLRLNNIETNPGWYTDETTHVIIAQNLLDGRVQYLAVTDSFLLFARLPLFQYTLAATMALLGEGLLSLRILTGGLGIVTVGLVYALVRQITHERWLALAAAFSLAVYPTAIIYSRVGFSYALLTPLILIAVWGLANYTLHRSRIGLAVAALATGLGLISDLMIGTMIPVIGLTVLVTNWRDLFWSMPLCALPFGGYTGYMLLTRPEIFLFDLQFTVSRLSTMTLDEQIQNVIDNYEIVLTENLWITLGLIGLFLIRQPHLRALSLLAFLLPVGMLARTVALYHLSFYYLIPLLPIPMIGVGALLVYGSQRLHASVMTLPLPQRPIKWALGTMLAIMIIWMPVAAITNRTWNETETGFETDIDAFLINPADGNAIADFINARVTEDNIVIGSVPFLWDLDAQVTDYQPQAAWAGMETVHIPADLPRERYAFDPSFDQAKFIIVDNLWRFWGEVHVDGVLEMSWELQNSWELVFEAGDIQVYQNPALSD